MTVKELITRAGEILKKSNVEDPSKEAGLLLSWVIKKDLGTLYAHSDYEPEEGQVKSFWSAIERRAKHEPFAYITGECEFMSLSFEVSPHVLIPRPDTEFLAEAALTALGCDSNILFNQPMFKLPKRQAYRVLDIGTGSGCLAVALAKYCHTVMAEAVDISTNALQIAKRNAERHFVGDRVSFIHADFLSDHTINRKYDLMISNPPYIPSSDIPELMQSVRDFEPHTALVGGEDGLLFYRAIADKADALLSTEGIIAVECGFDQAIQIQDIFSCKGMETLLIKDLAGINRVVAARKQSKV